MSNTTLFHDLYRAALPSVPDRPPRSMPKSLYGYVFKVSARQQLGLCLLTVVLFPITMVPLELQRRIVDDAVVGRDVDLLILLGSLYLAVVVGQGLLKFLRNIYLARVGEGVARLLRIRFARGDDFDTDLEDGTTQAVLSVESEKIGGFVADAVSFPLLQIGIVLSVAGYMLFVEPLIAMVAVGFLVPTAIVVTVSQPILNRMAERKITTVRELGECVLNTGDGQAGERAEPEVFIQWIYRLRLRFAVVKNAAKGLNNLINHLGLLSVLLVGGWLVIRGQTEVGTIVAFMSGFERMTAPVRDLLSFYRRLAIMRVQYRLVYEVVR